jgi:hypothetical protein
VADRVPDRPAVDAGRDERERHRPGTQLSDQNLNLAP